MEWAPVSGALPPMNDADWQRLFHLYQQIPQYALVNQGFGLAGFKQIFWLEWIHRLWGRLIGVAFLVPLIWFWATGRIERRLRPLACRCCSCSAALQGAVGWFMVASGFLPDATAVSPYRLVIHLALALALYVAILWTGLTVLRPTPPRHVRDPARCARWRWPARCSSHSPSWPAASSPAPMPGFDYNTFPLMDGHLLPAGYARLEPFCAQPHGEHRRGAVRPPAARHAHRACGRDCTLAVGFGRAATGVTPCRCWHSARRRRCNTRSAWRRCCWCAGRAGRGASGDGRAAADRRRSCCCTRCVPRGAGRRMPR